MVDGVKADAAKAVVQRGYDRCAETYLAARPADGADIAELEPLLGALEPLRGVLGRVANVLDAGCGAGVPVTEGLAAAGHAVTGLDLSAGQLALAHVHVPNAAVVLGDLAALPFGSGTFDAVVSYYAVIHVPRVEHHLVFAEIHRVLRPGGLALLCLGWLDLPDALDPDSWLGVPMYWSHFDADTNLRLLGDAGLVVHTSTEVVDPMDHVSHQFVLASRP
jgi:SAM-dependent methyltransferase